MKHEAIRAYYNTLFATWGCLHWWPAESRWEMIVGAYLTQNTSWTNVEKALSNLRSARMLTIDAIRRTSQSHLETLIRPSGYFRQKAQNLKIFVEFLDRRYAGSLSRMFARPTLELRDELLALKGVGPETADSILLYAGNHPVFVVDAYTRRILERHQIISADATYEEVRALCEQALAKDRISSTSDKPALPSTPTPHKPTSSLTPAATPFIGSCHPPSRVSRAKRSEQAQIFNDMHGLIVGVGKHFCLKSQPRCDGCPLQKFLPATK
jgi:endonuclease-3 related protein